VAAVNPIWLWVALTLASVAVGGAMLWIAFAAVNKRQRQQHGFEVKTGGTTADEPGVGKRSV
jgi:hypothetical protein